MGASRKRVKLKDNGINKNTETVAPFRRLVSVLFHLENKKNRIPKYPDLGAGNRNRTDDLVITNDVLYRLSHTSITVAEREGFEPS